MAQGKITAKQKEILDYIKEQILERGYPPAVREICEAVHLKSTSSVHSHLETLEKNGYIRSCLLYTSMFHKQSSFLCYPLSFHHSPRFLQKDCKKNNKIVRMTRIILFIICYSKPAFGQRKLKDGALFPFLNANGSALFLKDFPGQVKSYPAPLLLPDLQRSPAVKAVSYTHLDVYKRQE